MKFCLAAIIACLFITAFVSKNIVVDETFKQLYALEGKWIMKTKKGVIGEEWIKLNENHLQSKGFFVKDADTVITERIALKKTGNDVFYISAVENQNDKQPVSFKLTSADKHVFVFENALHDFPKRIIYEFVSADSLHAYIDGGTTEPNKRQDFYYNKIN